jgi:hypothetical protein
LLAICIITRKSELSTEMPTREQTATPASRAKIEDFVAKKRAQLWIGHGTSFFRDAIKSPGWYE